MKKPSRRRSPVVQVLLDEALLARVEKAAERDGRTLSNWGRQAFVEKLESDSVRTEKGDKK